MTSWVSVVTVDLTHALVDKSKLIVLAVDGLYLVIPLTVTKVETRLRNVFINLKPKLDGLARFMQFYITAHNRV